MSRAGSPEPARRRRPPRRRTAAPAAAALLAAAGTIAAVWPVAAGAAGTSPAPSPAGAPASAASAPELPGPLTREPGDPRRGRAVVASRTTGLCLLCHRAPIPEEHFQGDLAPDLAGVGRRLGAAEIRRQLLDPRALNPDSIMPAVQRTEGLTRVAPAWKNKPVLTSQQVEDVVAYLGTLQ